MESVKLRNLHSADLKHRIAHNKGTTLFILSNCS